MTFDPVPWFTGGGAQHSPEVARLLAYAATGGAEGVVSPGDLKVVPLAVPGASVRVLSGAALILNRAAGGSQQTYVARNPSEDVVNVSATGSSGGRTDMIVARIEDPYMPGEPWANPSDPTVGPYVFSRVIPNVPGSAIVDTYAASAYLASIGSTSVPLAAVSLPSSTATVTAGMIKDLRKLGRPRSERMMYSNSATPADLTSTDWVDWILPQFQVLTPAWATHAEMRIDISGIKQTGALADALLRAHLGTTNVSGSAPLDNDGYADGVRHSVILTSSGALVPADKGKLITLKSMAMRISDGAHPGGYRVDSSTHVGYDIQFFERAV